MKWGGAIAALMLILLTIAGKWNYLFWLSGDGDQIYLGRGFFAVDTGGVKRERGWYFGQFKYDTFMILRFTWHSQREGITMRIPLWFPAIISGGVSGVVWRRDRTAMKRLRAGCCVGCGYDRTGIPTESPCPECSTTALIPR